MSETGNQFDEFGIKKIYKSSKRSDAPGPFVMGIGNWRNRIEQWDGNGRGRFSGSGLNMVYTSTDSNQQRMNVYADPSKPEVSTNASDLDRDMLMNRQDNDGQQRGGWMARFNDWRDYEVTAIEFIPNQPQGGNNDADDTSAWYGRGAKHKSPPSVDNGSQGTAYKPDLWYAGNNDGWSILKETIHHGEWKATNDKTSRGESVGQNNNIIESKNFGNLKGKWFGIKTILYNEPKRQFGNRSYWPVVIETYVCECDSQGNPDNNWRTGIVAKDDPQQFGWWSDLPSGQPSGQPRNEKHTISWGGPIITCRTDSESGSGGGYSGMQFKKISIREIDPGNKF